MSINPKIPLWEAPKMWAGETVVCIGGGPSLTDEQVEIVKDNARVIAINDGYIKAPWADVLYGSDAKWWRWHDGCIFFDGLKVAMVGNEDGQGYQNGWQDVLYPDIKPMASSGIDGLEVKDSRFLKTGSNSGYQAINLAVHFGAKRIILLGYDMQSVVVKVAGGVKEKILKAIKDESDVIKSAIMASVNAVRVDHWFGAHPDNITSHPFDKMLAAFESLKSVKSLYGVEIINCTPGSALEVFPKKDLEEVLDASC